MHLSDKQKLREEWEELQEAARQPHQQDGRLFSAATRPENADKNRRPDRLPYDRTRVRLLPDTPGASDYINASLVQDSRLPRHLRGDGGGGGGHILTQSPLTATIGEFWRLVWQTGATGLVNLARPGEPGLPDYWPDRGCAQFGGFQVHLVSEHVCSDHFVIRSLRVRPLAAAGAERRRLGPARTVTQFHYLSWEEAGVPPSTSSLLEFRRKVNKSYRSRSSPLIVHCSATCRAVRSILPAGLGARRLCSGIGCLKEVSLAASLEHLRDQRPGLVDTAFRRDRALTELLDEAESACSDCRVSGRRDLRRGFWARGGVQDNWARKGGRGRRTAEIRGLAFEQLEFVFSAVADELAA
uniref:Tyrosine-protein phosphatase domain-containing protein n=1 Tax=Macrostomum lignano TaxID=282301 RepID=A0A1I8JQS5_9PLAT